MEELFPFLAGLAYIAYKIYANYQKAQEEARNRNPSQPYPTDEAQPYQDKTIRDEPELYVPEPVQRPEPVIEKYYEPKKYESSYKEPLKPESYKEPAYKATQSEVLHRTELYNPEVPVEEVIRNREIHGSHKHRFIDHGEEELVYPDFDFTDAIIKEAILNRPQY